jgi:hypothetical protein
MRPALTRTALLRATLSLRPFGRLRPLHIAGRVGHDRCSRWLLVCYAPRPHLHNTHNYRSGKSTRFGNQCYVQALRERGRGAPHTSNQPTTCQFPRACRSQVRGAAQGAAPRVGYPCHRPACHGACIVRTTRPSPPNPASFSRSTRRASPAFTAVRPLQVRARLSSNLGADALRLRAAATPARPPPSHR